MRTERTLAIDLKPGDTFKIGHTQTATVFYSTIASDGSCKLVTDRGAWIVPAGHRRKRVQDARRIALR